MDHIAGVMGADPNKPDNAVGSYIFHQGERAVRVCIDAFDSGSVMRPDLLAWSDLYFKANYWPDRTYPAKVTPMAFLNPSVLSKQGVLIESRKAQKDLDLFASFRVWGGTDETEGVEHNLALFEALARVKCRKKLLAFLLTGDIGAAAKRLDKAGVPWTTQWVPQAELWSLLSRSRLNIVRHGMHHCVPWRMAEVLAMGGCAVLDYAATTRWHVPLVENVHYLNLGFPFRPGESAAARSDELAGRVEAWVSGDLPQAVGRNAELYFDEHLAPEALGRFISLAVAATAANRVAT